MGRAPIAAVAPRAVDDDLRRLHIFISYAHEDAVLAQAMNAELKTAFSQAIIRTTLDSELKLGVNWRSEIEEALSDADVLLIVATGRHKPSHSYTGYEVGFFSASTRAREKMKHFASERLIIPIGVLAKIPETLADIEGLNLTEELTPFLVDEDILKDRERFLSRIETDSARNPFARLFKRLQEVVETRHRYDEGLAEDFRKRGRESAARLYRIFFDDFQNRVFTEKFPERKIIVRFRENGPIDNLGNLPPNTTLEFLGGTFEIFQINPPPDKTITWEKFIELIPRDDTSTAWTDIIRSLVVAAKQNDFAENRILLASADRRRFFRLFVARSVIYYSGVTELHIYVVEVKSRDYGDPTTTMLLKAIQVGLIYRSLFLEGPSSAFSPETIRATLPQNLPKAVRELLQELDYVLWMSTDAGLSQPRNIIMIYPNWERGELEKRVRQWEKLKSDLNATAIKVLGAKREELDSAKDEFEDRLGAFCSATVPMNEEFLANVLHLLEEVVEKNGQRPRK